VREMGSRFEGKVALLMGAATGMGQVAVERFAEEGATVVAADVNPEVVKRIEELGANGARGFGAVSDITRYDDVSALTQRVVAEYGRIDIAVAFSGVVQDAAEVVDLDEAEWDRVMSVNLKGHFFFSKAVAPHMRDRRSGRIILISSFWGRKGFAYYAAYCASKAGVISLTHTLSEEMAPYGVTVNNVAPGMINTTMHEKALHEEAAERGMSFEEFRDREWSKIPLGKAGQPADIVAAVMFLASDEASYITGASLDVNGGVLLR
jgi:NAD(P)-dependent dehydrogenase (short-subunit alcohol dehydrogenase family)